MQQLMRQMEDRVEDFRSSSLNELQSQWAAWVSRATEAWACGLVHLVAQSGSAAAALELPEGGGCRMACAGLDGKLRIFGKHSEQLAALELDTSCCKVEAKLEELVFLVFGFGGRTRSAVTERPDFVIDCKKLQTSPSEQFSKWTHVEGVLWLECVGSISSAMLGLALGCLLVPAALAAAWTAHGMGQQLMPRLPHGALVLAAVLFQHWILLLALLGCAGYWLHLYRNIWWLVEIGWRKESSELLARARAEYYGRTGDLRHARVATPLELAPEPKAGEVVVVRTCKATSERLHVLPERLQLTPGEPHKGEVTLVMDPEVEFQEFMGFGTSFTESSASTFKKMGSAGQERIIDAYFDKQTGLGFNLGRLHMNSCDFSDGNWSCCDKEGDLAEFCVDRYEDAILPLVRRGAKAAKSALTLFASPWSPPAWMKDNSSMCAGGKLKADCREAWAKFYVRFAEELKAKGVALWGFSVQNEPDGQTPWENCLYSPAEERDFIRDHLGPALANCGQDLKLIAWDHNRDDLFQRAHTIYADPEAAKYVWGMGWHWYGDPRYEWWADAAGQVCFENVRKVHELRPEKHLMVTETCQEGGAHLGDWSLAERYAEGIIKDFNNWCEAWVDWNMLLTHEGGPNHVGNLCSAPVLADLQKDKVIFQPSYYAFGHFSRHIKPGARRILSASNRDCIEATAFANPDGILVAVVLNQSRHHKDVCIQLAGRVCRCPVLPHSITTLSFKLSASEESEVGVS
ncbi:unnamed protein product [Effrenium voratum]|nr:unnamed protein product [Effrenium voratum]